MTSRFRCALPPTRRHSCLPRPALRFSDGGRTVDAGAVRVLAGGEYRGGAALPSSRGQISLGRLRLARDSQGDARSKAYYTVTHTFHLCIQYIYTV